MMAPLYLFAEPAVGVLARGSALCAAWPDRLVALRGRDLAGTAYLVDLGGVSWDRLEIIATALGIDDPAARALLQELCEVCVPVDHFVMLDDLPEVPRRVAAPARPELPDLEHVITVMAPLADRALSGDLVAAEAYEIIRAYAQ